MRRKPNYLTAFIHKKNIKVQNALASDQYYQACWPQDLAGFHKIALTTKDVKWFEKYLHKYDSLYRQLPVTDQQSFLALSKQIEEKIPMIFDSGSCLPGRVRLFLSAEMAKPLLRRSRSVLDLISSVVLYSTDRLLKAKDKNAHAGAFLSRGFFHFVKNLIIATKITSSLQEYLDGPLHSFFDLAGLDTETYIPANTMTQIHNSLLSWETDFRKHVSDKQKKEFLQELVNIKSTVDGCFGDQHQQEIPQHIKELQEKFDQVILFIKDTLQTLSFILQKMIDEGAHIYEPSQSSIHMSFSSLLAYNTKKNRSMMTHEMAHALEYDYDYQIYVKEHLSDNQEQFTPEASRLIFNQTDADEMPFLDAYAFHNHEEFFAVCSEYYMTNPFELKKHNDQLHDGFAGIYGSFNHKTHPWSTWKLIKISITFLKDFLR